MHIQRGENAALEAVSHMHHGTVVPVTEDQALNAALLSIRHHLPMADSLILAVARTHEATLWTQDTDFQGLEGVRFIQPA
jgi:predicted nucleic acid-binding protein